MIMNIPRDMNRYHALKQLISEGAGKQDVIGRPARYCDEIGKNNKWMEYEKKTEEKHARILVPQLEKYTALTKKTVLDFGSGTGGSAVAIAARGALVTGVEPIHLNFLASIERAKTYRLESRIKFIYCSDTSKLPFDNQSFDICFANSVFEYIIENRQKYFLEIWRVLNKGGLLFITDTSNGIYPFDLHTGKFWINYQPKRVKRLRAIRGVTYWEIMRAFNGYNYSVLNFASNHDNLTKYFYHNSKGLSFERRLSYVFFRLLEKSICKLFDWPIEALLPWLNIVLRKDSN
jgi:ubiquinone/menaquinone biosynthesis C-methylase UbiE